MSSGPLPPVPRSEVANSVPVVAGTRDDQNPDTGGPVPVMEAADSPVIRGTGRLGGGSPASAERPRPRLLLGTGLGLVGLYVVFGLVVRGSGGVPFTQPLDDWWRTVNGVAPDSPAYTWWLPMTFQFFGELGQIVIPVAVMVLMLTLKRWRSAVFVLAASVFTTVLSQVMKHVVERPRPAADAAAGLYGPLFSVDFGSYPSGHCVTVATFVVAFGALIPSVPAVWRRAWWAFGALLMVGIVWQRTLINAHWLSDTLAGLVAGAGGALLVWWLFWPWLVRDQARRTAVAPVPEAVPAS